MQETLEAEERIMKAAAPLQLREAGQSLWLDNITRHLLTSGTLTRYIIEFLDGPHQSKVALLDQV